MHKIDSRHFDEKLRRIIRKELVPPGPDRLSKATNIFSIVGTVMTTVLAVYAIILSIRYGESRDQIERLDTLITSQQGQIANLIDILGELRTQNQFTQDQNAELRAQGTQLGNQSQAISEQLKISQTELATNNKYQRLGKNAATNEFINAFYNMHELWEKTLPSFLDSSWNFRAIPNQQKISFLKELKSVVESQLKNSYLLADDTLQTEWFKFSRQISTCMTSLVVTRWTVIDDNGQRLADSEFLAKMQNDDFKKVYFSYLHVTILTSGKMYTDKVLPNQRTGYNNK